MAFTSCGAAPTTASRIRVLTRTKQTRSIARSKLTSRCSPRQTDIAVRSKDTSMKIKWINGVAAIAWMLAGAAFMEAHAQQTIFNVPSSDVLDKGKVYGELDVT